MSSSFNLILVVISYIVAVIASYTTLELVRRVITTTKLVKLWIGAGSVVMGIGVWTMHFVGMIAFEMDMPHSYDILMTLFSLGVGIFASWFAIFIASRKSNNLRSFLIAGFLFGLGIAAMHYTGMAAMKMNATINYDPLIVTLSILIAIVAAIAALWLVYTISNSESDDLLKYKVLAAMVMGLAICGMHYTGMFAASYEPYIDNTMIMTGINENWLAVCVTGAALFILGITHLTIFFDYKLGEQQVIGEKLQGMVEERTAELNKQTEDLRKSKNKIEKEMEDRKKAQKEADRLSILLHQSSNEIYIFDYESLKFSQVNEGACHNLGYTNEELMNMTALDIIAEEYKEKFKESSQELTSDNNNRLLLEVLHVRADGSAYPVEVNLQLSEALGSKLFFSIVQDVSDKKELESKLNRAQRLESVGQLAAGVAHEINTPTQFVGDNLRFLSDSFDDLLKLQNAYIKQIEKLENGASGKKVSIEMRKLIEEADIEYLIEEIPPALTQSLDGTTHIANIVRAMKEFSHPGGKEQKPVDINATIASVITVASNEWKYTAEMKTYYDQSLPLIPCFAQEFSQVILNLIVNAAHAISDNTKEASTVKGCITIVTALQDKVVEIQVQDTGGGIPKAIQESIFDPFFTTKEVGRGTGQGLSIAHAAIVEKMRGSLSFETAEGIGTTFIIHLPLHDQD